MFITSSVASLLASISYDPRYLDKKAHLTQAETAITITHSFPGLTHKTSLINESTLLKKENKNVELIDKELKKSVSNNEIAEETYHSFTYFLHSLPPSITTTISEDNMYISDYRTINLDFYSNKNNLFSIEFGKNDIGFFTEINNNLVDLCESVIDEKKSHLNELLKFYNNY